jgi:hypothetical protein
MDSPKQSSSEALPPHVQLIQMATAGWVSRVTYAAARLGLADHLAEGPKTAAELGGPLSVHVPSLHRLMRTLASLGILTERGDRRFALTPLGEALKTGAPGSARASLLTIGSPWFNSSFENIIYSLQTGETGFEKAHGMPVFDYLAQHPDDASLFSETMIGIHGEEPAAVADAYDFSVFGTVVDVGGATGNLLSAILLRHPRGSRHPVRPPACRDGRAGAACSPGSQRPSYHRGRDLLREGPSRRRRLYPFSNHPRLERRAVPDNSRSRPQSHETRRTFAARGDGAARG